MNTHRSFSYLRNLKSAVLATVVMASFLVLCVVGIVSSTAQSTQKEKRVLEDEIPKHLPLKIKVKNLNNEKWARDVEVEITNTGDKPIYHLLFSLSLPNVLTENNRNLGFPLRSGRGGLADFNAPLEPDDVPIKPGETYTFKIPDQLQRGWERFVTRQGLSKIEPKKARLVFQLLNFGDGTGFNTTDGLPVDIHQKQADGSCKGHEEKEERIMSTLNVPPNPFSDSSFQLSAHFLPASFLPVNFSPVSMSKPASGISSPRPDVCGCSSSCSRLMDAPLLAVEWI